MMELVYNWVVTITPADNERVVSSCAVTMYQGMIVFELEAAFTVCSVIILLNY
jgi:hypothetical protein